MSAGQCFIVRIVRSLWLYYKYPLCYYCEMKLNNILKNVGDFEEIISAFRRSVSRQRERALKALSLHFAGELMRLVDIALVNKAVRVAPARAEEFRPAVAAAFLAVYMGLCEIWLDVVVERPII